MQVPIPSGRVRFGVFEVNLRSGELLKHGIKVKLHAQPFQILATLLEHPGEVVTREELREKLWPADTFVDFDVGLNSAIKKLRDALGDSAEAPRFVETLPRKGYRLIASVDDTVREPAPPADSAPAALQPATSVAELIPPSALRRQRTKLWLVVPALVATALVLIALNAGGLRQRLFGTRAAQRIQSLAVLPLENFTGDPAQEYFVDGMTDALITDLAGIGSLRVISRTSAMHYKGSKKPLPQIGRELGVDTIVEGSVVRSGSRVRIDAQLIHAATDRHLWAKSYQRELSDIVALQSDVAQAIAAEVQAKLTSQEQSRLSHMRVVNPEAYEAYLLGRFYWTKRDAQSLTKSISYYEQALAKDPNYAATYAGLAESYGVLGFGFAAQEAAIPANKAAVKARAAAMKALELDNNLAAAHAALGFIYWRIEPDPAGAERELRRAIELNPSYATAYFWYAHLLTQMGRNAEALESIQRAHQLDPLEPNFLRVQGQMLTRLQRYDEAMQALQKALALAPDQLNLRATLAEHYEARGMYPQALAEYQRISELKGGNPKSSPMVAFMYARMGRKDEAEKILRELKGRATQDKTAFMIALVTNALGRTDEALSWLERARVEDALRGMNVDNPGFGPLRSDPRFQSWLKRVRSAGAEAKR